LRWLGEGWQNEKKIPRYEIIKIESKKCLVAAAAAAAAETELRFVWRYYVRGASDIGKKHSRRRRRQVIIKRSRHRLTSYTRRVM